MVSDNPGKGRLAPVTPSDLPHSLSAPTSRLQRQSSLRRPKSSSFPHRSIRPASAYVSNEDLSVRSGWEPTSASRDERPSVALGPFAFEARGTETTKSSWLQRMSTYSSSKNGSPSSSPQPGSPSISYSNASTAPILPVSTNDTPVPARNKLVKRVPSQRALHSGNTPSPRLSRSQLPLRRPATSHQRSATLQQFVGEDHGYSHDLPSTINENQDDFDLPPPDLVQGWRPYFRTRKARLTREGHLRKRSAIDGSNRSEPIRCIRPVPDEYPTLLLADSINSVTLEDTTYRRNTSPKYKNSFTSPAINSFTLSSKDEDNVAVDEEVDPQPRNSFSIGDFFSSSPSPSTWKNLRTGSLRKKGGYGATVDGKRVASAPQPSKARRAQLTADQGGGSNSQANELNSSLALDPPLTEEPNRSRTRTRTPSSPLPPLNRLSAFEIDLPGTAPSYPSSPQPDASPSSPSPPRSRTIPTPLSSSPIPGSSNPKSHRPSRVISDRASTLIGSENDNSRFLSGDEDDLDFQSETVFDSLRTGATSSSQSGLRSPRIETIFDEPPPPDLQRDKLVALQDLLSDTDFARPNTHDLVVEEEESIRTPRRTRLSFEDEMATPVGVTNHISSLPSTSSSPPFAALSLRNSNEPDTATVDSHVDEDWLLEDPEEYYSDRLDHAYVSSDRHASIPLLSSSQITSSLGKEALHGQSENLEQGKKPNLFDWSERSVTSQEAQEGSFARPKTMHGKQRTEGRSSRPTGRRGPSALHLRSQSVPVPPESSSHRGYNNASKIDSWVLGGKGVSEDWDGDFEFDEAPQSGQKLVKSDRQRETMQTTGMLVPKAIMERQASVHGQFGQVKELTLLVEELKRLRAHANAQGIMQGQSAELWKEAEGIINLATLDEEEAELLPPRSPHSPSFDDLFEEDLPGNRGRHRSGLSPPKDDLLDDRVKAVESPVPSSPASSKVGTPTANRPRKESAAKVKSVLENIHQRRSQLSSSLADTQAGQKKLPFDTTSLRDLVVRAGVVTRALKEIVRKSDNTPQTPDPQSGTPPDPPFSQIFNPPSSPVQGKNARISKSASTNGFLGGSITGNDNEINGHMKVMTVV